MSDRDRKIRAANERDRVVAGPTDYPADWLGPAQVAQVQAAKSAQIGSNIMSAAGIHSKPEDAPSGITHE